MKSLTSLYVSYTLLDDAGLAWVARLSRLERLEVAGNPTMIRGIPSLLALPRLKSVEFYPSTSSDDPAKRRQRFLDWIAAERVKTPGAFAESAELTGRLNLLLSTLGQGPVDYNLDEVMERLDVVVDHLRDAPPELIATVAEMVSERTLESGRSGDKFPKPLRLRVDELFQSAVRQADRPALIFRVWARTGPRVLALEEARHALEIRGDRVPGRVALEEIIAIGDHRLACLAAAVACEPCPRTWADLQGSLAPPLDQRALAAWQESDPDNAAAWYCGLDGIAWFNVPGITRERLEDLVESIRRGNACPELRFGEPFPAEIENSNRAVELLADAKFPIQYNRIAHRDEWPEIARDLVATHELVDRFANELVEQARDAEAEACRAAVEAMMRRFIVASPREFEAVVAGCKVLRIVLRDREKATWGRPGAARSGRRLSAIANLDEAIQDRFDQYSNRPDGATHRA
jgi:hypothetical protein